MRERYAAAASAIDAGARARCGAGDAGASCCAPDVGTTDAAGNEVFGASLYDAGEGGSVLSASLGCGVPTAVADLSDGDVVLDLGSGAGGDVLLSARRVAPSGRAIGLDMTDEMLALARPHVAAGGKAQLRAAPFAGRAEQRVTADIGWSRRFSRTHTRDPLGC